MSLSSGRRLRCAARSGLTALPLLLIPATLTQAKPPAADAPGLIAKMENVYKNAKTFQVAITHHMNGKTDKGQAFSVIETHQIRFQSPNRVYAQIQASGTGAAAQVSQQSVTIASDGKTLYLYSPAKNVYAKKAAPPTVSLTQRELMGRYLMNGSLFSFSMGSPAKVNGRDAYIVLAKRKVPTQFRPETTPQQKAQILELIKKSKPTQVAIDKQNFQLLHLTTNIENRSEDITLTGQSVNGALAANAFVYHLPANAKPYTPPPAQPGGSGIPGLPGVPGSGR